MIIDSDDGARIEGQNCDVVVYSGQCIHTISYYKELVKNGIRRLHRLKGDCAPWVEDTHPYVLLHVTDVLKMLPGFQATKVKVIAEAPGNLLEVSPVELISSLNALTTF